MSQMSQLTETQLNVIKTVEDYYYNCNEFTTHDLMIIDKIEEEIRAEHLSTSQFEEINNIETMFNNNNNNSNETITIQSIINEIQNELRNNSIENNEILQELRAEQVDFSLVGISFEFTTKKTNF